MSTLKTTNIAHPSSASNNIVLDATGGVDMDAFTVSGSAPADSVNLDASGRLLVGTSTAVGANKGRIQVKGASGGVDPYAKYVIVSANDEEAGNTTLESSGSNAIAINADPDNLRASSYIGFGVDGTERMRIDASGDAQIGATANLGNSERLTVTKSAAAPLAVNRTTSDGRLVALAQAGTIEGDITVSGTAVSYNGAHLSRWSQLSGGGRTEILRGTVLSNIDEMCVWGEEDNEQLNRMRVSDIEGDPNVAGVFQGWDDDDNTYTDDFYCAMTGDFIIRIAEGVTVQRGDLLMSAGDGTAKPQDDDIVRSKTVAKVTSTHVTCTYDDGSYCVPCVLMAC